MDENSIIRLSEEEVEKLGVPVKCKGFYYLVYAIVLSVQIGMRKVCLNKEIYDRIAVMNNVSPESVEKCIRNSLFKAWQLSRNSFIEMTGNDVRRPTNGEVISFISSRILLERSLRF